MSQQKMCPYPTQLISLWASWAFVIPAFINFHSWMANVSVGESERRGSKPRLSSLNSKQAEKPQEEKVQKRLEIINRWTQNSFIFTSLTNLLVHSTF